ncbi:heme ABC transporter substrate-binding protein IsdE [Paenibacillus wulumuqiensis]|uniref:heme ABC transporter substrate-binding protein IsdE n=1 Tax=Paenibacillus wulumuqiensis TaxID=1567107 RepID=UPI0006195B06|nr:heme ABC transporter substrate-binding protein IsdE [Paenibacillus wulumuqiensis]
MHVHQPKRPRAADRYRRRLWKLYSPVILLISLTLALSGCSPAAGTASTSAAAEQTGTAAQDSARIVATTVAITEIASVLDLDLVGKPTSGKTLPQRYASVPDVGNPMSPDMEKVLSLQPTDILSVTTLKYDLEPKFKDMSVNAEFLNLESLGNMEQEIRKLGKRFDRTKQADQVITKLQDKVKQIQQQVKGKSSPKVLILLGVPGSYLVATENSYIGDLVRIAGGTNVVQGEQVEYLASNTEYLQQSNPDIILRAAHGMPEEVVKMFDEEFKTNDIWKHFNAVQKGHVYDLPEPLFGTTASLNADAALDELLKMLYPAS